jgi:hypothetical protein
MSQPPKMSRDWLSCPKWHSCSAPVCPLDHLWANRSMQSEDPVCFYLSEAVKDGAEARFEGAGLGEIFHRVTEVIPELVMSSGRVRRTLERAQASGSRMDRRAVFSTLGSLLGGRR